MTTVTISDIGTDEVTIPVSDTSDIIVQTLSDGPPLGSYIADHSLATNLEADDHPQYLNITRGDARYASLSHEQDLTLHYDQASISIQPSQIIGYEDMQVFTTALQTKLTGIEAGAQVNYINSGDVDALTSAGSTALHYHSDDRNRSNHTGTQALSTVINPNTIGTPSTNLDLSEYINSHLSAGITGSLTVTHTGSGNLDVGPTEFLIRDTDSETGTLFAADIAQDLTLNIPDLSTRFLYIDYNAGSPVYGLTADPTTINMTTRIAAAILSRADTVVYIDIVSKDNLDANAKLRKKLFFTEAYTKGSGGILTNPSGLQIAVSAGNYWFG